MDITALKACSWKLPSGAVVSVPAGWTGDVTDEVAVALIAAGDVAANAPSDAEGKPQFTPEQAAVLAAAADEIRRMNDAAELAALQAAEAADAAPAAPVKGGRKGAR